MGDITGDAEATVLVVDDDDDLRLLFARWLAAAGFEVREASAGMNALREIDARAPDVVVLDVVLPGLSGLEVCQELRRRYGRTIGVLMVSGIRVDTLDRASGLMLGADDYVTKPIGADELVTRVRRLAQGAVSVIDLRDGAASPAVAPLPRSEVTLTNREREVLGLLARGFDGPRIASELVISQKTVTSHVQRMMAKLGAHTRAQAVARALADGLIDHPVGAVG